MHAKMANITRLGHTESKAIASLKMPTCAHRLAMGGQTESESQVSRRKMDASSKKAISVQPFARSHVHTSDDNTKTKATLHEAGSFSCNLQRNDDE